MSIEALDLVALHLAAAKLQGKPGHKKALKELEDAKTLWRRQGRKLCLHCGNQPFIPPQQIVDFEI